MTPLCQIADSLIQLQSEPDIATVIRRVRQHAQQLNFNAITIYYLATVASELATNLYLHGGGGEFAIQSLPDNSGIVLSTVDEGPGIADINAALTEGFSTVKGSLGCGLPGVKRLMDQLTITSTPWVQTTVSAKKWR